MAKIKLDKAINTIINVVKFFKQNGILNSFDGVINSYSCLGEQIKLNIKQNKKSDEFELIINCDGIKCTLYEYDVELEEPVYTLYLYSNNSYLVDDTAFFDLDVINTEIAVNSNCYSCDFDLTKIED